jgi:hypothetical protein
MHGAPWVAAKLANWWDGVRVGVAEVEMGGGVSLIIVTGASSINSNIIVTDVVVTNCSAGEW